MRRMMIDRDDAGFRKHAQRDRQRRTGRQRSGQRYIVDIFRRDSGDAQAGRDRGFGEATGLRTARELGFFDGGGDAAVLNDGGGRVAQHSADSEYVQLPVPRFSILAQVSFNATVRLKTGDPGVESGSTQK